MAINIFHGDCMDWLRDCEDESVDSFVTDPPYGMGFMGRDWDKALPDPAVWVEMLRVAKPGTHAVIFGHPRLYHRLACAVEDAGWEIRDCLMWLYGTGFPKSLDVSKAIDKAAGAKREVTGERVFANGTKGRATAGDFRGRPERQIERTHVTSPATPEAEQWNGWGTALKPSYEPVILARKPLTGTVASNVLEHGVGGINIDGCRITTSPSDAKAMERCNTSGSGRLRGRSPRPDVPGGDNFNPDSVGTPLDTTQGRWPANLILDEEAGALLDKQSGDRKPGQPVKKGLLRGFGSGLYSGGKILESGFCGYTDTGGASRFFYCAKASRSEREAGLNAPKGERENKHPTVKPVALMRWLVRLVTPPGGLVVDPFIGSGTTGVAAAREGFELVGCELDEGHVRVARKRIAHAEGIVKTEAEEMKQINMDFLRGRTLPTNG